MKSLIVILFTMVTTTAMASDRAGGGGWLKNAEASMVRGGGGWKAVDAVKFLRAKNNQVVFQYKGFDKANIETHTIDLRNVAPEYAQALAASAQVLKWVAVRTPEEIKQCREACLADSQPGWELKTCLAGCEK